MNAMELATLLYEATKDMNYMDYEDTKETDISMTASEIEKAREMGLNCIMSILETIAEEVR